MISSYAPECMYHLNANMDIKVGYFAKGVTAQPTPICQYHNYYQSDSSIIHFSPFPLIPPFSLTKKSESAEGKQ